MTKSSRDRIPRHGRDVDDTVARRLIEVGAVQDPVPIEVAAEACCLGSFLDRLPGAEFVAGDDVGQGLRDPFLLKPVSQHDRARFAQRPQSLHGTRLCPGPQRCRWEPTAHSHG